MSVPERFRLPAAAAAGLVLIAATGFGIGIAVGPSDRGPDLSEREAFEQARDRTAKSISRAMARRGYLAGKVSGRDHGIIAGGMRAESDASRAILGRRAAQARSEASAVQSELAEITAHAEPPTPP